MNVIENLMIQIKKGSEDALRNLMVQKDHLIFQLAGQLTSDAPIAREIVQDTFLKIWTNRQQFDINKPAWPWISQITR
jgi:DNA-directed RNA polymerase specialized sigma24 family protein